MSPEQENEFFALKTLEAGDARSQTHFCLEVKALMKIKATQRSHLVDLVTTFKYDNKYNLLFRWANGGNLSDLWKQPAARVEDPSSPHKSMCWLAQQCWGLADALDGIHNARMSLREIDEVEPLSNIGVAPKQTASMTTRFGPSKNDSKDCGRHGDIKPPNILWFEQDENDFGHGNLKISDFGITTFHTEWTTKIDPKKEEIEVTYTYAAPEWDLKEDISRPFDIWSLGCVFLEFVTWRLHGLDGLQRFRDQRSNEKGSRPKFTFDKDNIEIFYVVQGFGDERIAIVKESVYNVSLAPPFPAL